MRIGDAILKALRASPDGLSRSALQKAVRRSGDPTWKFRRHLKVLEAEGLLHRRGTTRTSTYVAGPAPSEPKPADAVVPDLAGGPLDPLAEVFSAEGARVIALVNRPLYQRKPCSYERALLDEYRPGVTYYLRPDDRRRLRELGATPDAHQPAGTWARHLFERLLIDLSWNSSRLEGNTYSLLDTERLFRDRAASSGHAILETQMLLNHKQAIEFLVEEASAIALDPRTLRTLHGMLADNLLADPADEGRLRRTTVGIHDSVFIPLDVPQRIEELFAQLLAKAEAIADPFEQSFFLLVHIPYLQPFADVNKRTSRLAANIPLMRHNLHPLSFTDLPREAYTLATLGVYEQRRIDALRDVYLWAYRRSAERYQAILKSLGDPDPLRLRYRDALREIVRTIVRELTRPAVVDDRIADLADPLARREDRSRLQALARQELDNLNEGTFHRYGLRPSEFERWIAARPRAKRQRSPRTA